MEKRLRQLVEEPYLVGAHWFCFADEPPGGRAADGEDYNFGLVDIENRPYQELTAALTDLNGRAATLHAALIDTTSAQSDALPIRLIPRARGSARWHRRLGKTRPHPAATASHLCDRSARLLGRQARLRRRHGTAVP